MARLSMVFLAALVLAPLTASADVFKLYGEGQAGGMFGTGLAGDQKDSAFFKKSSPGLGYGVVLGGKFLIVDVHIKHTQYRHSGDLTTWTQFNAGFDFGIDTGSEEDKKAHKGGYFALGAFLGFGVGTGAQVDPPLDNAQITDKAFMLEGRLQAGKHLGKLLDVGVEVPVSWGYFFKSGNGASANNVSDQYQGMQAAALLTLRANITLL
jgi:hypothetical protein